MGECFCVEDYCVLCRDDNLDHLRQMVVHDLCFEFYEHVVGAFRDGAEGEELITNC